jgi:hypothetical protein
MAQKSKKADLLIPEIDNKTLSRWYRDIKPVVRLENFAPGTDIIKFIRGRTSKLESTMLFYLKEINPRKAVLTETLPSTTLAQNLRRLEEITTYHRFDNPRNFRPTMAEVVAQMPPTLIHQTIAFETVIYGALSDSFSNDKNYHQARTFLYTHKNRIRGQKEPDWPYWTFERVK